jgi:FtsZ-interacting cell division protein YlmF
LPIQEQYEDSDSQKGLWTRVRERVFGVEDIEETEDELPGQDPRKRAAIRLDMARGHCVAVRLHAAAFNDARIAADGLKAGQQQIVNLERATPQMAERIIDFLSGVTYALDGSVDRVGDKVYLFAPANVQVELDSGAEPPAQAWDRGTE